MMDKLSISASIIWTILYLIQMLVMNLEKDFRMLITPFVSGDQKLNILDQYVYQKLVYPMQTTVVELLDRPFLEQ